MEFFHMTKLGTIDVSSTPAEKWYFGGLTVFKLMAYLYQLIGENLRHTSKNFEGGSAKKIKRKKMFSPKRVSNLGRLTVIFSVPFHSKLSFAYKNLIIFKIIQGLGRIISYGQILHLGKAFLIQTNLTFEWKC